MCWHCVPGFSLRGRSYPNHGLVLRDDIGETVITNMVRDPDSGLHCISDFSPCCDSSVAREQRGEFLFPDGTTQVPIESGASFSGYYRTRAADRIFLNRLSFGTVQGIFQCQIRNEPTQTSFDLFYIGVYDADSGK